MSDENKNESTQPVNTESSEEKASMKDRVAEITGKLEQGLKEIFESDKYKDYLNTMAKFHNYSINNVLLINQQKPEATLVAGFNSWSKNFDRHVKKGEKGIKIIAPAPYMIKKEQPIIDMKTGSPMLNADGTPKTTEVDVKIPAFKVTTVFDISQTYGKELPTLGVNELVGEVDRAKDFIECLKKTTSLPIEFGETQGDSKGFYSPTEEKIVIKDGMSDAQTIKTMIHEIAHSKLHNPEMMKEEGIQKSKGVIEQEAESVAYVVCQHFGIDTSDYSFPYIAGWAEGKDTEELKKSIQTIRDTAGEMINRVEGNFRALEHDREAKREADKGNIPMEPFVEPGFTDMDKQPAQVCDRDSDGKENPTKDAGGRESEADKKETKEDTAKSEVSADKKETRDSKPSEKTERKSIKEKLSEKKKVVEKQKKEKTRAKNKAKGEQR